MSLLRHPFLTSLAVKVESGVSTLRWIDLYAAQYVVDCDVELSSELSNEQADDSLVALALMASFMTGKGLTHLDLNALPVETSLGFSFPKYSVDEWCRLLRKSSAILDLTDFSMTDKEGTAEVQAKAPLVLHKNRLYLARYWRMHQLLEHWLQHKTRQTFQYTEPVMQALTMKLKAVFKLPEHSPEDAEPDWQAVAAAHALSQKFTLVTGGPGTGKTTTVASVLYLLVQRYYLMMRPSSEEGSEHLQNDVPLIRLLAPTGKAAVKLVEAIRYHLLEIEQQLHIRGDDTSPQDVDFPKPDEYLPESGETIHRFLYQQGAFQTQSNKAKRFQSDDILLGKREASRAKVDIVVIDEASMVDLSLMVELINVLPDDVQLIMLGDHHQLPALEPGQVFAECVARYKSCSRHPEFAGQLSRLTGYDVQRLISESPKSKPEQGLSKITCQPLVQLQKTYRFGGDLKLAAELIKAGKSSELKEKYRVRPGEDFITEHDVCWHPLVPVGVSEVEGPEITDAVVNVLENALPRIISAYVDYFEQVKKSAPLLELSDAFDRFQILCTTHEGPLGVRNLNQVIESHFGYPAGLYHGKAILVTRNHRHLGVFNGDVGFVMASSTNQNDFEMCFPLASTLAKGETLTIAPERLREWQPAYALTVHKSQGSEYQQVCVVLADYARELLSRELLYTAVTRSKKRCDIWASEVAVDRAVLQRVLC